MNLAGAAILSIALLAGLVVSIGLTRVFAGALRRHGKDVLGFWERLSERASGPVSGTTAILRDDLRVWREILVHHHATDVEAARLGAWAAYGFTADAFVVSLELGYHFNDVSFDYMGAAIWVALLLWAAFWIKEAAFAAVQRSGPWCVGSLMLAALSFVLSSAR